MGKGIGFYCETILKHKTGHLELTIVPIFLKTFSND
jgi:hypothetical protein